MRHDFRRFEKQCEAKSEICQFFGGGVAEVGSCRE